MVTTQTRVIQSLQNATVNLSELNWVRPFSGARHFWPTSMKVLPTF